jgi:hypothetical protein
VFKESVIVTLTKSYLLFTIITDMIFVDNKVEDILYLLNLQIASFKNDAIPSKPVLYNVVFNTNDVNEIQPK